MRDWDEEERYFWERVVLTVATANDCKRISVALAWADQAVAHRREKFQRENMLKT